MQLQRKASLGELTDRGDYVSLPDCGIVMICPHCGNWFELGGPRCYPHQIPAMEPLSISPSVVCPWRHCHYIVAGGRC
jgi:hypothetical protein